MHDISFVIAIIASLLTWLVFIGCCVLAVRVYKKFLTDRKVSDYVKESKTESFITKFLSFDKLVIPGFLNFSYILTSVLIIAGCLFGYLAYTALPILLPMISGNTSVDILTVLKNASLGAIAIALVAVVLEIGNRFTFELVAVFFKMNGYLKIISSNTETAALGNAFTEKSSVESPQIIPQPTPGFCSNCGIQNSPSASFCRQCGSNIKDNE